LSEIVLGVAFLPVGERDVLTRATEEEDKDKGKEEESALKLDKPALKNGKGINAKPTTTSVITKARIESDF
jgi:hypothetical protein